MFSILQRIKKLRYNKSKQLKVNANGRTIRILKSPASAP